jgi:hypothetical protein
MCAGYETSPARSETDFTFLAGVLNYFSQNDRKLGIEEEKAAGVSLKIHSKLCTPRFVIGARASVALTNLTIFCLSASNYATDAYGNCRFLCFCCVSTCALHLTLGRSGVGTKN